MFFASGFLEGGAFWELNKDILAVINPHEPFFYIIFNDLSILNSYVRAESFYIF